VSKVGRKENMVKILSAEFFILESCMRSVATAVIYVPSLSTGFRGSSGNSATILTARHPQSCLTSAHSCCYNLWDQFISARRFVIVFRFNFEETRVISAENFNNFNVIPCECVFCVYSIIFQIINFEPHTRNCILIHRFTLCLLEHQF
jgi:hypothetical protein